MRQSLKSHKTANWMQNLITELYSDLTAQNLGTKPTKFLIQKTRKLPHFGKPLYKQYDFEWPKETYDILPTKDGAPVKIVAILYQKGQHMGGSISGIQVILSNG